MRRITAVAAAFAAMTGVASAEYYVAFPDTGRCSAVQRDIKSDIANLLKVARNADVNVTESILGGNIYEIVGAGNGSGSLLLTDTRATCALVNTMAKRREG